MSSEEQRQILKMVEDGRISAEEAMSLIKAIEASSVEMEIIEPAPASLSGLEAGSETERPDEAPEFERVARQARRLWQIPLWVSVAITVLSAYWLYMLVNAANFGFWFYCAWVPLLSGVLLLGLFAGGQTSRWLFLKVQQPKGSDGPRNLILGLPLPLGLAGWFLRNFGHNIESLQHTSVDEIIQLISTGISAKEPLIVNVDEGENGNRVQVYLG
jgi:hypothetical protein